MLLEWRKMHTELKYLTLSTLPFGSLLRSSASLHKYQIPELVTSCMIFNNKKISEKINNFEKQMLECITHVCKVKLITWLPSTSLSFSSYQVKQLIQVRMSKKNDHSIWLHAKERTEKSNKQVLQFTSPDIIWCISSTSHPIWERSDFTAFTCMKILMPVMISVRIHFEKAPRSMQTTNLVHKTYSIIEDQIKFKLNNLSRLGLFIFISYL